MVAAASRQATNAIGLSDLSPWCLNPLDRLTAGGSSRKQLTAIKYDDGLKEEQKTAKYKAWFKESGPTWFGFYERLLLGNSEGNSESFLAGNQVEPLASLL